MTATDQTAGRTWWYPFGASAEERHRLFRTRVPLVVILIAVVVLERLDQALRGAHSAGQTPGSFGDVAAPFPWTDPARRLAIAAGWQSLPEFAGRLINTYFVVDLVLMAAIAFWLVALYQWRSRQLDPPPTSSFRRDAFAGVVGVYLLADLVETGPLWWLWTDLHPTMVRVIAGASLVKWLVLGVSVAWLAVHYRLPTTLSPPAITVRKAVLALRGQLLVVGVLIGILLLLNGDIGRQVDEVMVVASSRGWSVLMATVAAVLATVVLAMGGMACLRAYLDPPSTGRTLGPVTPQPRSPATQSASGAIAAKPEPVSRSVAGRSWIVLVLADVPLLALSLAIVRATATVWTSGAAPYWSVMRLVLWGVGLWAFWLAVHLRLLGWIARKEAWDSEDFVRSARRWSLALGSAFWVLAMLPLTTGGWVPVYQALGTPAVLMVFAFMMGLLLTGLTLLSDNYRPGGTLERFGVTRLPVFTAVLVLAVVASVVDTRGAYYLVRTAGSAPQRESVQTAFTSWAGTHAHGDEPVPLVFVAAAGGGIRAAYWTRLGMDCVFGTSCGNAADHTGSVFLASGVSGGSLGLVSTRSRQQAGPAGEDHDIDVVLGQDFIAPSLAAFLLLDQPNGWLRLPISGVNRADTLEQAWERADPGLNESFAKSTIFPKLILNSTSVEDGCRLEIAEVTFPAAEIPGTDGQTEDLRACSGQVAGLADYAGPGSMPARDAFGHLCDARGTPSGLTLSTAALMSARFPYVSPAGGLLGCKDTPRTFALDGGAVDNSGGTAVLEAWLAIADEVAEHNRTSSTCVVPKLVILDSGQVASEQPPVDDRPPQLTAPLVAALGGFGRRSSTPLAQAARAIREGAGRAAVECGLDAEGEASDAVVVIAPQEQPGPGLPLGWTLSDETRAQMRCQMNRSLLVGTGPLEGWICAEDSQDNQENVARAQAWFS